MEGGRENTFRQRQSNETDIQTQVTLQTRKTREGTERGIALERSVVVKPLGSLNRFKARQTSLLAPICS
jgi:hypothetical protein